MRAKIKIIVISLRILLLSLLAWKPSQLKMSANKYYKKIRRNERSAKEEKGSEKGKKTEG